MSLNRYILNSVKKANAVMERTTQQIAAVSKANVISRSKNGAPYLSGAIKTGAEKKGYYIWVDAPYAEYVEYGTGEMRGKHFVEDAIKTIEPRMITKIFRKL